MDLFHTTMATDYLEMAQDDIRSAFDFSNLKRLTSASAAIAQAAVHLLLQLERLQEAH